MFSLHKKLSIPSAEKALVGRDTVMPVAAEHFVNGHPLKEPFPDNLTKIVFGLGCFWGAERKFWQQDGVYTTAVGYAGGHTKIQHIRKCVLGMTGHNEVVLVVFDETVCSYEKLVKLFFESHNPTQGMRQGNDQGTQYRSGIYCYTPQQKTAAKLIRDKYQQLLQANGFAEITTEIMDLNEFYYAEDYHQQYLAKIPMAIVG